MSKGTDAKYLVDRYEKLRNQYEELKAKDTVSKAEKNQYNFGLSDLINKVLEVK